MKSPLLPFDEALRALLSRATPVAGEQTVATLEAAGRVLARDVISPLDVPPLDNAQMDGYAIRLSDLGAGHGLTVSQRIAAGSMGVPLAAGGAARIFTGAPLPEGADTVVMQEEVQLEGDRVQVLSQPSRGDWIRRRGEDIAAGSVVLPAGTLMNAPRCGLAASVGLGAIPMRRRVRVACFFTGDELRLPGEPLAPGTLYNSNRYVLRTLLESLGCTVQDLGIVPDSLAATRQALREASVGNDLIVTSGGMSVGEEDHVKPAVQAEGFLDLWQIAIKPGKPLAYGRIGGVDGAGSAGVARGAGGALQAQAHFIGLPGNPVSSFVTFLLFVRPFVRLLQGAIEVAPRAITLRADFDWPKPDRRREFLRARLNEAGGLDLYPNQGSGVLTSTAWSDGLIDNPPQKAIQRGDPVSFLSYAELMR